MLAGAWVYERRGMSISVDDLPSLPVVGRDFIVFLLAEVCVCQWCVCATPWAPHTRRLWERDTTNRRCCSTTPTACCTMAGFTSTSTRCTMNSRSVPGLGRALLFFVSANQLGNQRTEAFSSRVVVSHQAPVGIASEYAHPVPCPPFTCNNK